LPGGEPPKAGSTWKDPDLAITLARIAAQGSTDFYQGQTADLIATDMKQGKGLITKEDLRAYRPKWREPVEFDYRGHHVISMPPPSSGGLVLGLVLQALEGWDIRKLGWHSADAVHVEVELLKRAFALRNEALGDPDVIAVPRDAFLS